MNESAIVVVRASHGLPFIEFLDNQYCDVDALLRSVDLERSQFNCPNNLIPEHSLYSLLENASCKLAMPDIGFRITEHLSLDCFGVFGEQVLASKTLVEALNRFIDTMGVQSNCPPFWLKEGQKGLWFCRQGTPNIKKGLWPIEQHVLSMMIQLIRAAAGEDWAPSQVHIQNSHARATKATRCLKNTKMLLNQKVTAVFIEQGLLNTPLINAYRNRYADKNAGKSADKDADKGSGNDAGNLEIITQCFVNNTQLIGKLLRQDYFSYPLQADKIAKQVGMNIRKLQRSMAEEKGSLKGLIQTNKIAKAKWLLLRSDKNILDISLELGYKDAANFSRNFKKSTGLSPKTFRQQRLTDTLSA